MPLCLLLSLPNARCLQRHLLLARLIWGFTATILRPPPVSLSPDTSRHQLPESLLSLSFCSLCITVSHSDKYLCDFTPCHHIYVRNINSTLKLRLCVHLNFMCVHVFARTHKHVLVRHTTAYQSEVVVQQDWLILVDVRASCATNHMFMCYRIENQYSQAIRARSITHTVLNSYMYDVITGKQ